MSNGLFTLTPESVAREACGWVLRKRVQYEALLRPAQELDAEASLRAYLQARLGDLTERERAVLDAACDRLRPAPLTEATAVHETRLGETMVALTTYAQRGDLGPFGRPEGVPDAVGLFTDAIEYREDGRHIDLPAAVWTVVFAATGRARLALGLHVSPRHLAALGDVTPGRIRQLAAGGVLERDPDVHGYPSDAGMITAESATRWLDAHGVRITPEVAA